MTLTAKDEDWIVSGRKTAHADPERLGYAGDIIAVKNLQFEIIMVKKVPFSEAVKNYCYNSGYDGPWTMAADITKYHSEIGWKDIVFVHLLKPYSEAIA